MFLQKLSLVNFKNYELADFAFSDKINCLTGNNGVGKTNLLDAIHYLSFCKSYFNPADSQNVRHGAEFFAINGRFRRDGDNEETVQCIQKRNQRKRFMLNKKEYERLADHIGNFPLVMISPYDRDLINEGSELRRRYIDSVISQFDKAYLDDLIQYNKALVQRNALLKAFAEKNYFDAIQLEIWDEQILAFGASIHERRKALLSSFIPIFQHYYTYISGGSETVGISYDSQLSGADFRELMKINIQKDRAAQFTTAGIHKDDLDFTLDTYPVKKFGSQGQQKSFVVAIKLAQFDYTRKIKGYKPILLLDDVFDKLDDGRVQQLIGLVSENSFGQVFITDTSSERIRRIFDAMEIDHRFFSLPLNQTSDEIQ
jgi:DNA replication and repair protein RecF